MALVYGDQRSTRQGSPLLLRVVHQVDTGGVQLVKF
jgi:hypothetical protein